MQLWSVFKEEILQTSIINTKMILWRPYYRKGNQNE